MVNGQSAVEILQQVWGYPAFRPMQDDIVTATAEGRDVLAILPTGGGKSITFQVPALMKEGLCLVISPLIALMKDQVHQLRQRNIPAVAIYSGLSHKEIDIALDNCIYGEVKFLYCSPERLKSPLFEERVRKMNINLIAVDEAHCISQWGYDFRPPYLEIGHFREIFPEVNLVAVTASATPQVRQDIVEKLRLKDPAIFQASLSRPNLSYSVFMPEYKEKKMLEVLNGVPGSAIIYVRNRLGTQKVAEYLRQRSISADFYHAGLQTEVRFQKQEDWINDKTRVMVATNAFGMGIDKKDVRLVIHLDVPDHLEAYYQEAGRAGRDEQNAYAVILATEKDLQQLQERIRIEYPEVKELRHLYQQLANFLKVAVGSSNMASYDFDLHEFCRVYELKANEVFHAMKKLEEEGFILLNQSFHEPSKLFIPSSHEHLYEFQVANQNYDLLIKALLRTYGGGMFSTFVKIDEQLIARGIRTTKKDVQRMLNRLSEMDIVQYAQQKEKPQLTFLTERYDAAKLPINEKSYLQRKEVRLKKMNAMRGYVEQKTYCRTRMITEYFGELQGKDCGICDVCLERRKNKESGLPNESAIKQEILNALSVKASYLDQLIAELKPENIVVFTQTLRLMLDEGLIEYAESGKVRLTTNV